MAGAAVGEPPLPAGSPGGGTGGPNCRTSSWTGAASGGGVQRVAGRAGRAANPLAGILGQIAPPATVCRPGL
ncbi:MAG UNVERIFIED_CONTAM: hypothetical protein LVR29_24920 [Microcystis novacekii LVE1205-3]